MMWQRWIPWRYLLKNSARAHGLIDPVSVLARVQRFAQPSEVAAPVELLRLAARLQVQGLLNAQAIQHNLDWAWPYWVARQFDPHDPAFIPRAFSLTHINLSHRNWTAVGQPGCSCYPIIDPRGLVTPFYDGWSLDFWMITSEGAPLLPARLADVSQGLEVSGNLAVTTRWECSGCSVEERVEVFMQRETPYCHVSVSSSGRGARLIAALRPFNPEGVSFVEEIEGIGEGRRGGWRVNKEQEIYFSAPAERMHYADYFRGDVLQDAASAAPAGEPPPGVSCRVGMASAAAVFHLGGTARRLGVAVPLAESTGGYAGPAENAAAAWERATGSLCRMRSPDARLDTLFEQAVRALLLHAPAPDVYPGPYTYKHFWFRDAAMILHALLCANAAGPAEAVLRSFPRRQRSDGYFCSQEGEWDSNGQALWILQRRRELCGGAPGAEELEMARKGAEWIIRKRLKGGDALHAGLLPAGFSAEHLGPNDYYYWDDFWAVAGLRAAAELLRAGGTGAAETYAREASSLLACVEASLLKAHDRLGRPAMPASPYRRLDSGAVGSLAADYPLHLWRPRDPRVRDTAEYLLQQCFVNGGFFHDMSHSGINPYLSLHVAQVLLRSGDARHWGIIEAVARMASATGQWPEAVHPRTLGGCMGDGQHIWAAAEWVLALRNCFVREDEGLHLFSGLPPEWLSGASEARFGPTRTAYGTVEVALTGEGYGRAARWRGQWTREPERLVVAGVPRTWRGGSDWDSAPLGPEARGIPAAGRSTAKEE